MFAKFINSVKKFEEGDAALLQEVYHQKKNTIYVL